MLKIKVGIGAVPNRDSALKWDLMPNSPESDLNLIEVNDVTLDISHCVIRIWPRTFMFLLYNNLIKIYT